jgi:hypothetical protein
MSKMKRILVIALMTLLPPAGPASATVLKVPGDYVRIQTALNSASTGDTVLVDPGIYHERLLWPLTGGIKMLSSGGAQVTVIDADARESACGIYTGVDTTTVIRGFTFTDGDVGGA